MRYAINSIMVVTPSPPSTAMDALVSVSPEPSRLWCVVPARKGSKGVPDKNVRPLGRASLLERAVETALALGGHTVLSTDYGGLAPSGPHVTVVEREPALATDSASMWDVLADIGHRFKWKDRDVVVLLQPTSLHPDRANIIKTILKDGRRHALTADRFPDKWHPWYAMARASMNYIPSSRQNLPPRFRPNGLAYVMSGCTARHGAFWESMPEIYEVDGVTNVDTPEDWAEAERLYGQV